MNNIPEELPKIPLISLFNAKKKKALPFLNFLGNVKVPAKP